MEAGSQAFCRHTCRFFIFSSSSYSDPKAETSRGRLETFARLRPSSVVHFQLNQWRLYGGVKEPGSVTAVTRLDSKITLKLS